MHMQTYVSISYAESGEKHGDARVHKQLELLKVLLNGSGRMRSPRESDGALKLLLCFPLAVGNKQSFSRDKTGLSLH